MLKKILNIKGVQELNKTEQKSIQGEGNFGPGFCFTKPNGVCCDTFNNCHPGVCTKKGCLLW